MAHRNRPNTARSVPRRPFFRNRPVLLGRNIKVKPFVQATYGSPLPPIDQSSTVEQVVTFAGTLLAAQARRVCALISYSALRLPQNG